MRLVSMKRVVAAMAAFAAMGSVATPRATAQEAVDPLRQDLRCAVVGFVLASNTDATMSQAGTMLSIYYVGRLKGRAPELDLADAIAAESARFDETSFDSERTRCGGELRVQGEELIAIGNELSRRDGAAPAAPRK